MIRPTPQRTDGIVPGAKFVQAHLETIAEANPYVVSIYDGEVAVQGRDVPGMNVLVATFGHDHVRRYADGETNYTEYTGIVDDVRLRLVIEGVSGS